MDDEDTMDHTETSEYWTLQVTVRDREREEEIRSLCMSWENRPQTEVKANLNSMFAALGISLKVVDAD